MVRWQQQQSYGCLTLLLATLFLLFNSSSSSSTNPKPPLMKEQAEEFERYRSQISRQKPRVSSDNAEMEIVYPKKLAQSAADHHEPSLAVRMGGAVRLQRSQRDTDVTANVTQDEHQQIELLENTGSQWLGIQVYRIRAFNRDFLLTVNPRETFLAPNFVVQHLRDNETWVDSNRETSSNGNLPPNWQRCFFSGIVNYERDSNVAMSLCRGMFGIFRFKDNNYFIEPYSPNSAVKLANGSTSIHDRPHLIYKFKTALEPLGTDVNTPPPADTTSEEIGNSFDFAAGNQYSRESALIHQQNSGNFSQRPAPNRHHARHRARLLHYQDARRRRPRESLAPGEQQRVQRSTSKNHYVELMVAADHRMRAYHGSDTALEAYILTLMAVVASVYRDPTIGNPIHVLLMKVIIVHNEKDGPVMSQRAPEMLQSFCQWQSKYNDPDTSSPNHYDAAILLTRHDICRRSEKCDTLGLAEMGTICDREKSCAVVEDNGLSAAFTIIHELGHLFNLPHDSDVRCRQFPDQANGIYHVMAPTLDFNTNPWSWSQCSRKYATDFLDNDHGHCLWNIPTDMALQRRLDQDFTQYPGINYDTNFQCQLVFGRSSRVCPYMPVCKRLWCTADIGESDGCRTQHMPWADGTTCGSNRWCIKGECIAKDSSRPNPVDGQWSSWSAYGPCSRTCGGGIKMATRTCTNPAPANGGKFCVGERQKFKSCNTKECPATTQDFREEQCSKYNGDTSRAERLPQSVLWVPKYDVDPRHRCKLYCEAFGTGISVLMESQVIDGTKCGPDTTDICVAGVCHPAGCDNKLYSNAQFDACGQCAGDNSTCNMVEDSFTRHMKYGYNEIVTIPKGAANIEITQSPVSSNRADENYLAIKTSSGEFLLNGNFLVNGFRREIRVRGAVLEYSGSHHVVEYLNTTTQIGEDLHILVLAVGSLQPAKITYKWFISDKTKLHYRWRSDMGEWSVCDRTCQGLRYMQPRCVQDDTDELVEDHYCFGQEQPVSKSELCNSDCQLVWTVSRLSRCSVTCGEGVMRRQFSCIKMTRGGSNETLGDEHCLASSPKPRDEVACSMPACYQEPSNDWEYSAWGQCSTTCGRGYKSRKAKCINMQTGREVSQTKCDRRRKQLTDDICEGPPCLNWKTSEWDQCSTSCGRGYRHRQVHCDSDGVPVEDQLCVGLPKPDEQEDCLDLPPCPRWMSGNWTTCSATCGLGIQTRPVWCLEGDTVAPEETCRRYEPSAKPDHERRCTGGECPFWKVGPWTQCSKSCGPGSTRRREIWCQTNEQVFDFIHCPPDTMPSDVEPCALPDCPAWIVSEWSKCSKSCGLGQRFRNVTCLPLEHGDKCDRSQKPEPVETCKLNDCPEWVVSEWTACSATCGSNSVQSRSVTCRHNNVLVDEDYCSDLKPEEQRQCFGLGSCPSWHMTIWGPCSSTCGNGVKRRSVFCRNETSVHPPSACPAHLMPAETQPCSNGECAAWAVGEWSPCSVTCVETNTTTVASSRTREVTCTLGNGVVIAPVRCSSQRKPVERQMCKNLPLCTRIAYSDWSDCSVTCGEGLRRRRAICFHSNQAVDMDRCAHLLKDSTILVENSALVEKCFVKGDCPAWRAGEWSPCSNACGSGEQRRDVWCESDGRPEHEKTCDLTLKPTSWQTCWGELCPSWAFSEWEPCSQSCGNGIQGRQVWCQLGNATSPMAIPNPEQMANPHFCGSLAKPPTFQACSGFRCPVWFSTNFSECSAACGGGMQYRSVFCIQNNSLPANYSNGKVLGETLNVLQFDLCHADSKPETTQACNVQPCSTWQTTDWGECVADQDSGEVPCGVVQGRRKRMVFCQNVIGQHKVADAACSAEPRPVELEGCSIELKCTTVSMMVDDGQSLIERSAQKRVYSARRKLALTNLDANEVLPATTTEPQVLLPEKSLVGSSAVRLFSWQATGWSNCSATCGSGANRQRLYSCFNTAMGQLTDSSKCDSNLLPSETAPCDELPPCPTSQWLALEWSACSATCGRGIQTRVVQCVDAASNAIDSTLCDKKSRPKTVRYCLGQAGLCTVANGTVKAEGGSPERLSQSSAEVSSGGSTSPAEWRVGTWGQCSATCGQGIQVRRVACVIRRQSGAQQGGAQTAPQRCPAASRPVRTRRCQTAEACPEWHAGQWSECPCPNDEPSARPQFRTRTVQCRRSDGTLTVGCPAHNRPNEQESCPACSANNNFSENSLEVLENTNLLDQDFNPADRPTSSLISSLRPVARRLNLNSRKT